MRLVLLLLVALIVFGAGGCIWLGWYRAIPRVQPPARTAFPSAAIEHGAVLAALGNCVSCHTAPGGAPFAGGRAVQTPFGTIYASNITPDPVTGIGTWPEAAFRRAMRQGVDRAGDQLYPAFPYDHFTEVSDADDADLYAYLMTRAPVRAGVPANELSFPFDYRFLIAGWKLVLFRPAAFRLDATQSAQWNRGAYLVQGLAHCGACHTPHDFLGAEQSGRSLAGGEAQGWYAYALDNNAPAPVPWTADSLYAYLRHGWQAQHGDALGPMREVTDDLITAPDDDLRAMVAYLAAGRNSPLRHRPPPPPIAPPAGRGEALYRGACGGCHDNSRGPPFAGIDLAESTTTHAPNPANLANIITSGIPAAGEEREPIMPGFGAVLTERQTEDLIAWLRARFGAPDPAAGIAAAVQAARSEMTQREATP
ncbi:MAG TPA: cytochrome c [Acetobacteraceae bacterium]|nr:cytochrome c [Acetobacteraceae bacterium]